MSRKVPAVVASCVHGVAYRQLQIHHAIGHDPEERLALVISAYNTTDYHSGIANFIPEQVFDGSWVSTAQRRRGVLRRYYAAHPERFHRPPRVKVPAREVSINAGQVGDEYVLIE